MAYVQVNAANGKEVRRWCDGCGTLLLGGRCSICGSPGREFEINSPGDIRPCMGDSVGILEGLLEEAFGTAAPIENKSVFFNKVPGEDRTDEVVARGQVIAETGNTGISSGPHLHYEVIHKGVPVNPINYFNRNMTPEEYERLMENMRETNFEKL